MEDIAVFQFEKCLILKIHSCKVWTSTVVNLTCNSENIGPIMFFFVVKGLNMVTWPSPVDIAKGGTFYLSSYFMCIFLFLISLSTRLCMVFNITEFCSRLNSRYCEEKKSAISFEHQLSCCTQGSSFLNKNEKKFICQN